jgi:transcriptional regulator with XRE-family HTH domain
VTPSLISQIERGKTNPSVVTLCAIAGALGVSVDALLQYRSDLVSDALQYGTGPVGDEHREQLSEEGSFVMPVVRKARRRRVDIEGHGGDITWELLTSRPEKRADFLEITYAPGAASALSLMRHEGREYGLILEGELSLSLGFGEAVLGPGDSIGFSSRIPHRFENRGSIPMRAVWFVLREADAD